MAHRRLPMHCAISRASSARTAARAHSSFVIRFLPDASAHALIRCLRAGPRGTGEQVRAHQKGEQVLGIHAFTFASAQPVQQPVHSLIFRGASLGFHSPAAGVPAARPR